MELKRADWAHMEKFIERLTESGCWIWTGSQNGSGYGVVCDQVGVYAAHRTAWALANGPIPKGALICHRCNVRSCVNPEHLYAGDAADNARDRKTTQNRKPITKEPSMIRHGNSRKNHFAEGFL